MPFFKVPICYYEPGRLVRTPKARVSTSVTRKEYLQAGGVPYEIPEGLYKLISVDRVGASAVIRTFLGSEVTREFFPVTVKIVPLDNLLYSEMYYNSQGITALLGDNVVASQLDEVLLQRLATIYPEVFNHLDYHRHNEDERLDSVSQGRLRDTTDYLEDEVIPYLDLTQRLEHTLRDIEAEAIISPLTSLWLPDSYRPHRYDLRTYISLTEPLLSGRDRRYFTTTSDNHTHMRRIKSNNYVPVYNPNRELYDFCTYMQTLGIDEIYINYISSKGQRVCNIVDYNCVFCPGATLKDETLLLVGNELASAFDVGLMFKDLVPPDTLLGDISIFKAAYDVLYIDIDRKYNFVIDLTLMALGTQKLIWGEI